MRRTRKVRCPRCGAANYPTDPVCLSCGADLTPPPVPPVPTPVTPGFPPSGTSGTSGTPDDEGRYLAIGALVAVTIDVVFCVLSYALGDRSRFPSVVKIVGSLVSSALVGAVVGVWIARKRGITTTRPVLGGPNDVQMFAPFILWVLLMVWLAMRSYDRAIALKGHNEVNVPWLMLVVALAIGGVLVMEALGFLHGVRFLLGDVSWMDSWNGIVGMLAIALVLELLMFLAWPSNDALNLIAVLLTVVVIVYYVVQRRLFNE